MKYLPARQDPVEIKNTGAKFTGKVLSAIRSGSIYIFNDVKGRCPGDKSARKLNCLAFIVR